MLFFDSWFFLIFFNFADYLQKKDISKFTNLESLSISNNNFFGSLKPLKGLTKLKELHIQNTDISSGLEYLPNGLEEFRCYDADNKKQGAKSAELYEKELSSFNGNIQD